MYVYVYEAPATIDFFAYYTFRRLSLLFYRFYSVFSFSSSSSSSLLFSLISSHLLLPADSCIHLCSRFLALYSRNESLLRKCDNRLCGCECEKQQKFEEEEEAFVHRIDKRASERANTHTHFHIAFI